MKVYLAAPIFTPAEIDTVDTLRGLAITAGAEVFSPYHFSKAIWKGRAPKDCTEGERQQVLHENIRQLHECDMLFCVLNRGGEYDGRTDTGVVWEMGYATALTTARVHMIAQVGWIDPNVAIPKKGINLMLAGTVHVGAKGYLEASDVFHMAMQMNLTNIMEKYPPSAMIPQESDPIK